MIGVGILTVSDRSAQGVYADLSGEMIRTLLPGLEGSEVKAYRIVPDEASSIQGALCQWSDELHLDLILTTGGTGVAPRDITPEATQAVIDRLVPGIAEALRWHSLQITPFAMLARGIAGVRKKTLIINLPGSPKAVKECLEYLLPALSHAVNLLQERTDVH